MIDRAALGVGVTAGGVVTALIVGGSEGLRHFDWALLPYAMASIFSAGAIAYRYTVWLRRPPTWRYWVQGWRLYFRSPLTRTLTLVRAFADGFAVQRFIVRRSRTRWVMHAGLSWGSLLAFGITFPLVFGWIHFETPAGAPTVYRMIVLGFTVSEFAVDTLYAAMVFNALNASAIMVLIGIVLAVRRRLTEPGLLTLQQFGNDVVPLLLLFAVSTTGLGLTVSARWLRGHGFGFIAVTHMASVVALLCYLPFGKFFHIFQRAAQLGVAVYKREAARGPQARCARCREAFASTMQVADLSQVLDEVGMDLRLSPLGHYQQICPACRRSLWALVQGQTLGR